MMIYRKTFPFLLVLSLTFGFFSCTKVYIDREGRAIHGPVSETETRETPRTVRTSLPERETEREMPFPSTAQTPEPLIEEETLERTPPPRQLGARADIRTEHQNPYEFNNLTARLIKKAQVLMENQKLDQAFATMERALRIDGDNPKLWSLMAEIQLRRENPGQAVHLANKSNLLAQGDNVLELRNWRIIYEARKSMEDLPGVKEAELRVLELEQK